MHVRLQSAPHGRHYYGPFVSGCVCVCTSVWVELCRSRGLDNWLVLECQMDEEGIMVDSSCCHGVEVGMWRPPVKGGTTELFVNGPLAFLERPPLTFPPIEAYRALLWRGDGNPGTWQQAGDLLAPSSSCLYSPSFSLSWPSSFIFSSCSLSPRLSPSLVWPALSHVLFFSASILF